MADPYHPQGDDDSHERLVLPLVLPALLFLFAVLVVYGLSRIYLDLDTWHYKDVGMATPLAIGISLLILLISTWLAGHRAARWQIGFLVLLAAAGLTAGATWAAVHPEPKPKHFTSPTPTVPVVPGTVQVALSEFNVVPNPAQEPSGAVKFVVTNNGTTIHEFTVIKTDLAPDALPLDSTGFSVDETQVDVVASGKDLSAGTSEEVNAQLEQGPYVLICNVPSHYQSGMHVTFEVGPPAPGGGGPPSNAPPGADTPSGPATPES